MHRIEEPEEKKRVANESVEGLTMDIAAAEEEIIRWKSVAEQEAAAGRAVEQEFLAQVCLLRCYRSFNRYYISGFVNSY
ncbi:hypothetical protein ES319_D01G140600v1 [Gossypium barbadense]|uniref:Uncharacterized protein n=2 Tax=Gossypium TaxID=3633 RepID=A0A5J5SP38_GOSBA|nr:hypothetical protein ES319_D01G140600v1 [Gossypium barbadense]TYG83232.1 hypothetical protein ES288_D01G153000v1 [Gossypium darwinii]